MVKKRRKRIKRGSGAGVRKGSVTRAGRSTIIKSQGRTTTLRVAGGPKPIQRPPPIMRFTGGPIKPKKRHVRIRVSSPFSRRRMLR